MEGVRISEGPLWEVPLYIHAYSIILLLVSGVTPLLQISVALSLMPRTLSHRYIDLHHDQSSVILHLSSSV